MGSNRPSSYNIKDETTGKIVANVANHELATEWCFEHELKPSFKNNTCWRYTIEAVRSAHELEYKNSGLTGY